MRGDKRERYPEGENHLAQDQCVGRVDPKGDNYERRRHGYETPQQERYPVIYEALHYDLVGKGADGRAGYAADKKPDPEKNGGGRTHEVPKLVEGHIQVLGVKAVCLEERGGHYEHAGVYGVRSLRSASSAARLVPVDPDTNPGVCPNRPLLLFQNNQLGAAKFRSMQDKKQATIIFGFHTASGSGPFAGTMIFRLEFARQRRIWI